MEIVIKKCQKCGAMVEVLKDCECKDCGIRCCGENMITMIANSVDASFEKHIPNYEEKDGKIFAFVNHVMEEEHYIEWILYSSPKGIQKVCFKPNDKPETLFENWGKGTLYALCNKHGLWKKDII